MEEEAAGGNETDQQIRDVVVSPTVPDHLKDLVYFISQMVDAEMKRRCPGCGGLSAKPIDFVFNSTSPIPEQCSQTPDNRLCCVDESFNNLTVCLTYD